jgi:hypothetical protein
MLNNQPSSIARDANIQPETLVADLRARARLAHSLARRRSDEIDALYLFAAADEIERLRIAEAKHAPELIIIQSGGEEAQAQLCEAAGIPVIAEIEPHPDPIYGHLFKWPAEVDQFIALNP